MAATEQRIRSRETGEPEPAAWMRIARAGAIGMVVFAGSLIAVTGELIPPVAVIGLVYLGLIPFLKGERRRLGLVLAIISAVSLVGNVPFILSDLAHPESAPTFVLTLLSLLSASLAIAGGLGTFLRWRTGSIRVLAIGAAAVFVAGSVTSLALAAGTGTAASLPSDTVVQAQGAGWNPMEITAQTGTGIWIENLDPVHHSFTVAELAIDMELPASRAARVDLEAAPGTYQVTCNVPGHEGMTGTLVVTP